MRRVRAKIAVLLGTRPEIIKLSPLVRLLERSKYPYFMVHTGQHFSYEMDKVFFQDLELPRPKYHFTRPRAASGLQCEETARILEATEPILLKERPKAILLQGDTNSVLAGALAAAKIPSIRIGHVEAGLRSFDRKMPEEINRIVTDHLSHYLFAPTKLARELLLNEGVASKKIFVTGNTIVDALKENLIIARRKVKLGQWLENGREAFFLMTLHRQENVDHKERLKAILEGVGRIGRQFNRPIIFPVHPRTQGRLKQFSLKLPREVRPVKPMGFLDFLRLEERAELLLSDSGGVQEEGCILRVPCVTLRTSTERPETVSVGANIVAGYDPGHILNCAKHMLGRKRHWKNPFGDGNASQKILKILEGTLS